MEEHQPKTEILTGNEVEQILPTGLVDTKPLFSEGLYELKAGSKVGTAVLPSLRLIIRPKAGLRNLFFLLAYGAGLTRWATDRFPYEEEKRDLFEAVALVFEAEVGRALGWGCVRGYQLQRETLSTLRGRLDVAAQVRVRQGRPFPLECSFEEYTEDVEPNRMVKAALQRLLLTPGLNGGVVRRVRFRYQAFDGVSSIEYPPGRVPKIQFNQLNEHWEAAGTLARLILQQESLRDKTGSVLGISFTIDMNKLFERFVEKVVREEAQRAGYQLTSQQQRPLAEGVVIIPDLILRRDGRDFAVGDAKYKEIKSDKLPEEDLYQMLAYCVSLGLPSGLLIYAGNRFSRSLVVKRAGIRLEAAGIDLAAEPSEVLERTRTLAHRLLEEADVTSSPPKAAG